MRRKGKEKKLQPHVPDYELRNAIKDTTILRVLTSLKWESEHNCDDMVSRSIHISLNPDTVISSNDTIKALLNQYPFLKIALQSGIDITKIKKVNVNATGVRFNKITTISSDNLTTIIKNNLDLVI